MKDYTLSIKILVILFATGGSGFAQKPGSLKDSYIEKMFHSDIKYGAGVEQYEPFTSQVRTQMRDLGIGPYDVIPSGQSAITALTVAPNGYIFGGTTGEVANLFVFSPDHNMVFPLGTFPGEESIYHSMVFGNDGFLYIGTTNDPNRIFYPDESIVQGTNYYHRSVTIQIKESYQNYKGGHLYKYNPSSARLGYYQPDWPINKPCQVEDLGIPVEHEGIYTLLKDRNSEKIYGITYPGAYLFQYDIITKKNRIITKINSTVELGSELPAISKSLVQDNLGNIYANTNKGLIIRYQPEAGHLDTLKVQLPGIKGRASFNNIECSILHPGGTIYGGTTDGYLFSFDPKSELMLNFGKPFMESNIRAITVGKDGNIYGVGGEDMGIGRLFVFDVITRAFTDLGIIEVTHVPYFEWTGLVFDAIITGHDGSIYLGNSEYRSKLFIYNPR